MRSLQNSAPKLAVPGFAIDNEYYKNDDELRLELDREKLMLAE